MTHINNAINKEVQDKLTADSVLKDLLEGNTRFVGNNVNTVDTKALVDQTVSGQYPKAVVLSCIDSRVPVELVFDQTIGDIFVARVAGSKLVFVLGHESCGAVTAACDHVELGNITALLDNIQPAVKKSEAEVSGEHNSSNTEFVNQTIKNNVLLTIDRIREKSPILKEMEANGEIKIVGGVYHLSNGQVSLY